MWIKVDDGFISHPKVLAAAERLGSYGLGRAISGWLKGISYAGRHQTDGFIPARIVAQLDDPAAKVVAKVLVEVGLWETVEGGYRIHDYHDYNPRAEKVIAARKAHLQRQQSYLAKRLDRQAWNNDGVNDGVNDTLPIPVPSQSRPSPVPITLTSEGTRAPFQQPVPCIATGPHRNHAFCWIACVPAFLHAEFRSGLNNPDEDAADTELRAGYKAHVAAWPDGKATGDAIQFWRAWYRVQYPAPSAKDTKAAKRKQDMDAWLNRDTEARA